MDISKIVVGIDFSDGSETALEHAINVARRAGAEVVLVHCGEFAEPAAYVELRGEWETLRSEASEQIRQRLADLLERHSGQGATISQAFVDDSPVRGLCAAAEELEADLVVVGTHGRTGLRRFLLGSVAERVVRDCRRPVMVARQRGGLAGGYERILVPTDFSEISDRAAQAAVSMVKKGGSIDLFHCWTPPDSTIGFFGPAPVTGPLLQPLRDELRTGADAELAALIARYRRDDLTITMAQAEGHPGRGIQHRIESADYDLVVMGSRGRGTLGSLLLGSVAETTVRYAQCSVVVIH